MAVKTSFSYSTLKRLLFNYDLGVFKESKPFKAGVVQTNLLLKTSKGRFVLRYYENRNKKRVDFEARVLEFLSKKNYLVARPLPNKNNKFVGLYNKKPFILFEYVKGRHLKHLSPSQFKELVQTLATLHKFTRNFDIKNYVHAEPRTKKFCLSAARTEKKRFKDVKIGTERFNLIKSHLKTIDFPDNLVKSIVHGDFDKSNVKFNDGHFSGVLDFDDSHYGYRIHDLGIVLLYWARFYTSKFDFKLARNIVKYYEQVTPLTKIEKTHLFDAFKFAALMIMAWVMYDGWKGDDIFKTLSNILEEVDNIGRKDFYTKIFGNRQA